MHQDVVCHIDDARRRKPRQDAALHRGDERPLRTEVGGERDDTAGREQVRRPRRWRCDWASKLADAIAAASLLLSCAPMLQAARPDKNIDQKHGPELPLTAPGLWTLVGIALCFALSGFAALLYQTAWTRQFSLVFGTSELAVATVLAAYMAGLALGA